MDLYSAACENFGLVTKKQKTKDVHQPTNNTATPYNAPQISVNGTQMQAVDKFHHLGRTLSHSTKIDDEVARRISKASQDFGHLQSIVWNRDGHQLSMKLKMYKAVIIPTLQYGAETWMVYTKQARTLNQFHLSCVRRILRLSWQHRIPDITSPRVFAAKEAKFFDTRSLKSSLMRLQINPANWEDLAHYRSTWKRKVKTDAAIYEANRIVVAKAKRETRKSQLRALRNEDPQPLSTCPRCQRTFRALTGHVVHVWINCPSPIAPTVVSPPASSSSSPPPTNSDCSSEPPFPSSSSSSSSSSSVITSAKA
nr:unnamed protein product [Spirometra erinaceieuropaei]